MYGSLLFHIRLCTRLIRNQKLTSRNNYRGSNNLFFNFMIFLMKSECHHVKELLVEAHL